MLQPVRDYWRVRDIAFIIRKQFYQTALENCHGLKLPKCWLQFKKQILSFIIIFSTLSFPTRAAVDRGSKSDRPRYHADTRHVTCLAALARSRWRHNGNALLRRQSILIDAGLSHLSLYLYSCILHRRRAVVVTRILANNQGQRSDRVETDGRTDGHDRSHYLPHSRGPY